jgi:hypothetical protein
MAGPGLSPYFTHTPITLDRTTTVRWRDQDLRKAEDHVGAWIPPINLLTQTRAVTRIQIANWAQPTSQELETLLDDLYRACGI